MSKEYKWIARDEDEEIRIFYNKPFKESGYDICYWRNKDEYPLSIIVFKHLFKFMQWKDKEPYNIEELLREE